MPTYQLRGVDVDFPHEAYPCQVIFRFSLSHRILIDVVYLLTGKLLQLVYMEKVIQALQEVQPSFSFCLEISLFEKAKSLCSTTNAT
jgi:hypothetical protein